MKYYDWDRTLSYNAPITMVIASRGFGKTYGIRVKSVKKFLRNGSRFVEVCRFKSELTAVVDGYFDKIGKEFPDYIFKTEGSKGYIADRPDDEEDKPDWKLICYFVALTEAQAAKKRTYANVKTIIYDEAILERRDRFHNYLPREWQVLANVVDTVTRQRADDGEESPNLYMLGNAVDLLNPTFEAAGINRIPKFGYNWYNNKNILLHYVEPGEYAQEKLEKTLSGIMIAGTIEGQTAANNAFVVSGIDLIEKKPKSASFCFGVVCENKEYGVWQDVKQGFIYINKKIPKNTSAQIYYITRDDMSVNYLAARRIQQSMRWLTEAYYQNVIRYESSACMEGFLDAMRPLGLGGY